MIVAIAIQNIPEGTSVAIPMAEAGFGRGRQFWAAVATSAPQPVGAGERAGPSAGLLGGAALMLALSFVLGV
ncbi:MAG: hypothetical protein JJE35_05920 [Thermoleophilia bacterium]|nr:hypothetical protein [Thermoleophilia bacterium]